MGEAILLDLQLLRLQRIVQTSRLQILKQLLLLLTLSLQPIAIGQGRRQLRRHGAPLPVRRANRLQQGQLLLAGEAIEPAPLLAGTGQLLGLALNREIEQQGAQIQHLGPTDDDAIEPMATAEPFIPQPPVPAQQQIVLHLQLLVLQPGAHGGRKLKAGFNPTPLATAAQQTGPLGPLGSAQQGIESIQQN